MISFHQAGPQLLAVPQPLQTVPAAGGFVGILLKPNPSIPRETFLFAFPLNTLCSLQVTTNGIIATSEPPARESYPGTFPPSFGSVAPFLADLDTTDGLGNVYYREDLSPFIIQMAAEYVQRGFPEVSFQPTSVVVVTWESVAPYGGPSGSTAQKGKVSAPQMETWLSGMLTQVFALLVCACSSGPHAYAVAQDGKSRGKSS